MKNQGLETKNFTQKYLTYLIIIIVDNQSAESLSLMLLLLSSIIINQILLMVMLYFSMLDLKSWLTYDKMQSLASRQERRYIIIAIRTKYVDTRQNHSSKTGLEHEYEAKVDETEITKNLVAENYQQTTAL